MENVVEYHFAPSELYTLFAIGIACYTFTTSKYPSSEFKPAAASFVRILINLFFFISWVPLVLHCMFLAPGSVPAKPTDLPGILSGQEEARWAGEYVAYIIHIVTIFVLPLWALLLQKIEHDERDRTSEEDKDVEA